jgi:hypothetical protein
LFFLVLVLAPASFITNLARLSFKENQLYYTFIGIDAAVGAGGVGKL